MVHGFNYGVQLVFFVENRELDYFDDLLRLSIELRRCIGQRPLRKGNLLDKNVMDPHAFVLFSQEYLEKRFNKINREIHSNDTVFQDAYLLNAYLLNEHNVNYQKEYVLKTKSYEELVDMEIELEKIVENSWQKEMEIEMDHQDLLKQVNREKEIKRIKLDPEYEQKVISIEQALTSIPLSQDEIHDMNKILHSPRFQGTHIYCKFELVKEYY